MSPWLEARGMMAMGKSFLDFADAPPKTAAVRRSVVVVPSTPVAGTVPAVHRVAA
jgi:hypothetical protein